ncbi:SCF ubiquitin ligase complex subunit cdc4 [Marasmius crinis-equi]|uniref:SCF ubiquitin ligase complex subunit cdc4 n=1 Tax=Marasmius crinis-equi TaxID=585013 RepID=A0ABR3FCB3_9AGAR
MSDCVHDSEVYARLLFPLRHGCALWCPEPNDALSPEYRESGARIGDVGIMTADGGFDFIFNVLCDADDPINQYGVPDGFEPLQWDNNVLERASYFRHNMLLCSRNANQWDISVGASVAVPGMASGVGGGIGIKFTDEKGAVLMLPHGGSRVDSLNLATFRQYAKKHAESWYQFVNDVHGREAQNGAVYFITGLDKADRWENAVVNDTSREQSCELKFMPGIGVEGSLRLSHSSVLQSSVSSRCSSGGTTKNQSVFIRGFRVSVRQRLWGRGPEAVVSSIHDSAPKDIFGKKGGEPPFGNKKPPSPGPPGPSSGSPGSSSLTSNISASLPLDVASSFRDALGDSHYDTNSDTSGDSGDRGSSSEKDTLNNNCVSNDSDDSDTSTEEDDVVPALQPYHPLIAINDYILCSSPEAEVVVTHDDDWMVVLMDDDVQMPGDPDLICRFKSHFSIKTEKGCAFLERAAAAPKSELSPDTEGMPVVGETPPPYTFPEGTAGAPTSESSPDTKGTVVGETPLLDTEITVVGEAPRSKKRRPFAHRSTKLRSTSQESRHEPQEGRSDVGSVCPVSNALTDHGHTPRDGRNLTFFTILYGLKECYNLSMPLAIVLTLSAFFLISRFPICLPFTIPLLFTTRNPDGSRSQPGVISLNLLRRRGRADHYGSLVYGACLNGSGYSSTPIRHDWLEKITGDVLPRVRGYTDEAASASTSRSCPLCAKGSTEEDEDVYMSTFSSIIFRLEDKGPTRGVSSDSSDSSAAVVADDEPWRQYATKEYLDTLVSAADVGRMRARREREIAPYEIGSVQAEIARMEMAIILGVWERSDLTKDGSVKKGVPLPYLLNWLAEGRLPDDWKPDHVQGLWDVMKRSKAIKATADAVVKSRAY